MSYLYTPARGLGSTAASDVQVGGSLATSAATSILGNIASNGGTVLGLTGQALSTAIPIVGAALSAVTMIVTALVANSGCGQTCIETSSWANQAAAALQKNLDAYFALPAPRTEAQQALAIANFDTIWQQLQQLCGQAGTGNAGVRCITDRQSGACTWKQKYAPVYPGEPTIGECWTWFNGYLGPIQADPGVSDTASTVSTLSSDLTTSSGTSLLPILALIAVGALVMNS